VIAALKIIASVIAYRIRKLEMANLAAAGSIAVALRLPLLDIGARTLFACMLNALVYLNNDYIDLHLDLQSADKDRSKAEYLASHMRSALYAQWFLAALLTAFALCYDRSLFIPLIVGGGICVWYSAQLKHWPYWDIAAMIIWGASMPLCGVPHGKTTGWLMALQLGLFSGVFETIQVMRDADNDSAHGVCTTGVALGTARTLHLARAQMSMCSVYAALLLHPISAALSALALCIPFSEHAVERYWTRVKLVYGVSWLALCAWVFSSNTELPYVIAYIK